MRDFEKQFIQKQRWMTCNDCGELNPFTPLKPANKFLALFPSVCWNCCSRSFSRHDSLSRLSQAAESVRRTMLRVNYRYNPITRLNARMRILEQASTEKAHDDNARRLFEGKGNLTMKIPVSSGEKS